MVEYVGRIQPSKWDLHPEDFRIREDWERKRQRVLDAQVFALDNGLPLPTEKIPPIPALKYPGYRRVVDSVSTSVRTNVDKSVDKSKVVDIPVDRDVDMSTEPVDEVEDAKERRKRQQREWARKKRSEKA